MTCMLYFLAIYLFVYWLHLQHKEVPRPRLNLSHSSDKPESSNTRPPGNSLIYSNSQRKTPVECVVKKKTRKERKLFGFSGVCQQQFKLRVLFK